jgi:hypothetical protein
MWASLRTQTQLAFRQSIENALAVLEPDLG